MIVRNDPSLWWDVLAGTSVVCPVPQVFDAPAVRESALLGPDAQPLLVGYGRPRLGFDLRPREAREE